MKARAFVVAVGARTALGLTALQTAMVFRAGGAAMAAAPLLDANDEQITMCFVPTLDPLLTGWERVAALARPALDEALRAIAPALAGSQARLLLSIDERYAAKGTQGTEADAARALFQAVAHRASELLPGIEAEVVARGPAGPAVSLPALLSKLESRALDVVVLGGVHSDYQPEHIQELSAAGRLFAPDNLDSFIPGEQAAFVVLMREDAMRSAGLSPLAGLVSVASAIEQARPDNDHSAHEAKGLTQAIREATEQMASDGLTAGWAMTDLTFEMRRVHEWQSMLVRTRKVWTEPYMVESPAQRLGHLGAAAMPLQMALVATGYACGAAPAPIAIIHAGSDGGDRGAMVVAVP